VTGPVRRRFSGRDDQVSCARAFVGEVLGGCPRLDEALLLTSELCTNALQHSKSGNGGTFEVTVHHLARSLRVEVRDEGSSTMPFPHAFDDFSESGRGLEIVACLADRWGQNGDEFGRCVYFELRWTPGSWSQNQACSTDEETTRSGHDGQKGGHRGSLRVG
jgi:anti-sigma regulatory factor (Ser/Thr protein kinase)